MNGVFVRNDSKTGYAEKTETVTLPVSGPFVMELDEKIQPGSTITATLDAVEAEIRPWSFAASAGAVCIDRERGRVKYFSGDGGAELSVTYTPSGTVVSAAKLESSAGAPTSHTHTIANVTGLQTALDGKHPYDANLESLSFDYLEGALPTTYNPNAFSDVQTFNAGMTANGLFRLNAGFVPKLTNITGAHTVLPSDFFLQVNLFSNYAITLPPLANVVTGQFFRAFILNGGANTATFTANSGEFIISNTYANTYGFTGAGGKWFDLIAANSTEWLILPGVSW